MRFQDMEGYDEVIMKLLESLSPELRMAGLSPEVVLWRFTPEQRTAGLSFEERMAGLDRDQQALALPLEVVMAVSDEYPRSLSPTIEAELRRRIYRSKADLESALSSS